MYALLTNILLDTCSVSITIRMTLPTCRRRWLDGPWRQQQQKEGRSFHHDDSVLNSGDWWRRSLSVSILLRWLVLFCLWVPIMLCGPLVTPPHLLMDDDSAKSTQIDSFVLFFTAVLLVDRCRPSSELTKWIGDDGGEYILITKCHATASFNSPINCWL